MIEDYELQHEGRSYLWSHHEGHKNVQDRWSWSDSRTFTRAPLKVYSALNRRFIEEHAADAVADLEESEFRDFAELLRSMGAGDSQIEAIGLGQTAFGADTEDPLPLCACSLPEPAHTPYSNPDIRDWYFDPDKLPATLSKLVCVIGSDPFETADLRVFLYQRFDVLSVDFPDPTGFYVLKKSGFA